MARIEVLNEWFFPIPSLRENGLIKPAPPEAVEQYVDLRDGWLAQHPKLIHEVLAVSLSPGKRNEKDGYFVRTEILYK